ncbi:uncharacterized protein LOC126666903 [Mercurialis annua]|uniref:uncharacterized protein LOC126666903 n=1 Tax=Mercurialis annua TaxID=3986 RepID=UPI00215DDB21|nr:uncharacterized protein LOC126666903 [Mercurialis annua]XP_050215766.1 uncharacterized protein LOC126666903 [Mercurialis annua]
MDSWGLNYLEGGLTMTNSQGRRGLDLDLDLNYPLPPQMRALDLSLALSSHNTSHSRHIQATNAAVEALDDDEVAIISPRTFAEARETSERNHTHGKHATGIPRGSSAADTLCTNCKARMPNERQPYLKPGTSDKKERTISVIQESPQPVALHEESIFSCPVCMGSLIEPTSTRCGHIFCKECLQRSLKSLQNKCPTCRQKVGKRGIFRVYLPSIN